MVIFLLCGSLVFHGLFHCLLAFPKWQKAGEYKFGRATMPLIILGLFASFLLVFYFWRQITPPEKAEPTMIQLRGAYIIGYLSSAFFGIAALRGRGKAFLKVPFFFGVSLLFLAHHIVNLSEAGFILFVGFLIISLFHVFAYFVENKEIKPAIRNGHDLLSFFVGLAIFNSFIIAHDIVTGITPVVFKLL